MRRHERRSDRPIGVALRQLRLAWRPLSAPRRQGGEPRALPGDQVLALQVRGYLRGLILGDERFSHDTVDGAIDLRRPHHVEERGNVSLMTFVVEHKPSNYSSRTRGH